MKSIFLSELYSYRELIRALAEKEIKIKYKSAVLGWLWSLLNPLLLMVIFTVVFTVIIKIKIDNFPAFLLCALLPWFFMNFSLSAATTSIVDNSSLIKKTYFPHEVIPLSIVISNLFNFLISMGLLFIFLLFYRIYPSFSWIYLPLVVLLEIIFVTGICFACSALNTIYRDVKYAVELICLAWFYATPIFYPLSFVPGHIRPLFFLNPMTVFIAIFRDILLYGKTPSMMMLSLALAISVSFYFAGAIIFFKFKKVFADLT